MFILSPYMQDLTATQPSGAFPKAITNKRLYSNDNLYMELSKTLKKPAELPYPPRPPTPGPPRPNPPIPGPNPGPTPPPSPHHLLFYSLGLQLSILVSSAEPLHCPYPNPPPSPGPRRPGPVYPRPTVPTPPPSPRRSISPWISSAALDLIVLLIEYIYSATGNTGIAYGYVRMSAGDAMYLKWQGDDPYAKPPIAMQDLQRSSQQVDRETPHRSVTRRGLQ
ncbi:hypothetical protein F5X97DRAFT_325596 [Nemania serpens]|nr:hypothetical protein F5X97DRAFT_325596 [Nemania serpens]